MGKLFIGVLIGLLAGGIATFYFFVGVPSAAQPPGQPVSAPDPSGQTPETARIVLRQDLFNQVLSSIFNEMQDPTFPLTAAVASGGECPSTITILQEGSGVRTAVSFENNRLEAPIAFSGSYNSAFGCFRFNGWANSVLQLRFDPADQSVFGQLSVETVNLEGVNPLINAVVTPLVQSSINTRVNPIKIVDGSQLAVNAPITSANGNLVATVSDVRAEVSDRSLNLFVSYDVKGGPMAVPNAPAQ
jgi:hypothetical protein